MSEVEGLLGQKGVCTAGLGAERGGLRASDSGRATDLQDLQQRGLGWATQGTWGCAVCGGVALISVKVASQLHPGLDRAV